MPLEFGDGARIEVELPALPVVRAPAPDPAALVVLPVVGARGAQGPPGPAGTSVNAGYTHTQMGPDVIWTITHYLGFYPGGVLVRDDDDCVIDPLDIVQIDTNTMRLYFGRTTAGRAWVS